MNRNQSLEILPLKGEISHSLLNFQQQCSSVPVLQTPTNIIDVQKESIDYQPFP